VGLFAHCRLFVGNDTGPRHIAQALDISLLTIVSPLGHPDIANPNNHPRFQSIVCSFNDKHSEISKVYIKLNKLISDNLGLKEQ